MPRPTDWSPLAEADPVPGEPERVAEEARHLRDTAAEMRDQIARLRAIGQDGALVGRSADALRGAAVELHGRLERSVGRYEQVAGALSTWEPALQQAQDESLRIRERARSAEATRTANAAVALGPTPTPEQVQQNRNRDVARDAAEVELAAERRRLEAVVDELDDAAAVCADRITAAIDDTVVDSGWDDVKDVYDRHAEDIKWFTDKASYVATAVAVVAIFVAAPVVFWLALGLGAAVTLSQVGLAATGNGSWLDVGLSVFGLLTLGAGAAIGKGIAGVRGLSGIRQATRTAGTRAAGKAAEKAALASTSADRAAAGRTLVRRSATASQRAAARRTIDEAKNEARDAARVARRSERDRAPARANGWQRVKTGDAGAANDVADIRGVQARFPNDPRVAAAAAGVERRYAGAAATAYGGLGADAGDKASEDGEVVPGYGDTKDRFTKEVGSTW